MDEYYNFLRETFSVLITSEQLYQICRISKRKAKWLLEHKVIPCQDSGKKTRRYKIKIDDVIRYLQKCNQLGVKDLAPNGEFSSIYKKQTRIRDPFYKLYVYLEDPEHREGLRKFFEEKLKNAPDGLSTLDIAQITGFSKNAVNNWIKDGHLKAYQGRKNFIPKQYVLNFVCSSYYVKIHRRSSKQRTDLLSFLETIKAEKPKGP